MLNTFCPGRGSNQNLLRGSQTHYRIAIKAGLYRKPVQVCIIPNITTVIVVNLFVVAVENIFAFAVKIFLQLRLSILVQLQLTMMLKFHFSMMLYLQLLVLLQLQVSMLLQLHLPMKLQFSVTDDAAFVIVWHGIKDNPTVYLLSKYEFFLISGCQVMDI